MGEICQHKSGSSMIKVAQGTCGFTISSTRLYVFSFITLFHNDAPVSMLKSCLWSLEPPYGTCLLTLLLEFNPSTWNSGQTFTHSQDPTTHEPRSPVNPKLTQLHKTYKLSQHYAGNRSLGQMTRHHPILGLFRHSVFFLMRGRTVV